MKTIVPLTVLIRFNDNSVSGLLFGGHAENPN